MAKIHGGFYLKARCIQNSEIAHCPPHFREIWDWIIKEAFHKDLRINGRLIKRGQLWTSYGEITDGLKWKIGYRTKRYTKWECSNAIKWLRRKLMIETTKTTRGVIITVLNYDKYQTTANYESHTLDESNYESHTCSPNESHTQMVNNKLNKLQKNSATKHMKATTKATTVAPMEPHAILETRIKEERKKENKIKEKKLIVFPDWLDLDLWKDFKEHRRVLKSPMTKRAETLAFKKIEGLSNNGDDPNKIIEQSILRGWKSFFPLDKKTKKPKREFVY